MALARIEILEGRPREQTRGMVAAVRAALSEALKAPAEGSRGAADGVSARALLTAVPRSPLRPLHARRSDDVRRALDGHEASALRRDRRAAGRLRCPERGSADRAARA